MGQKDEADRLKLAVKDTEALASYKLKNILRHLNMSTFDYDIKKDTVYIRKELARLEGFTDHWFKDGGDFYYLENVTEALSKLIRNTFSENTREFLEQVKQNTTGEMVNCDAPVVYKEGNSRWTNFVMDTILDEEGNPSFAIGYCKDIHEQKKELYRLRNVAQTDGLTGFRNRVAGIYRIATRLSEEPEEMHFVAVIDLDKFKSANDMFGHSFGDTILKDVADKIRDFFDHETICCRTGGDEFLFARKCDNTEHAIQLLTDMQKHVEHTVSVEDTTYDVRVSIGVSLAPLHGDTFDELYNKADAAMYYAKNNKIGAPVLYRDGMKNMEKQDTIPAD